MLIKLVIVIGIVLCIGSTHAHVKPCFLGFQNKLEQIRKQNAMRGLVDDNGEIIKTPEEEEK